MYNQDPLSQVRDGLERAVKQHSQEHFQRFEEVKKQNNQIEKMFTHVSLQIEIYKKSFHRMERILRKHFPEDFADEDEDYN